MIKRTYFFSAQLPVDDSGSFSYCSFTADYKSWVPRPVLVYQDCKKEAEKMFKDWGQKPGEIHVLAFNKI